MIRIQQIRLKLPAAIQAGEFQNYQQKKLKEKILKTLRIETGELISWQIVRRSLDARKKPELFYSYIIDCKVKNETALLQKNQDKNIIPIGETDYVFPAISAETRNRRPVIVGMGPAGIFCGYYLAKQGLNPLILERGKAVEARQKDVQEFWKTGVLNPDSNVVFGEGGAGTFSDGKLNTLVKDKYGRNREVLEVFVKHGADGSILYEQKPHIGTDVLVSVVKNMRERMLAWGAEIRYETRLQEIVTEKGRVRGILLGDGSFLETDLLVLAIGHSARDTFAMCHVRQIPMEAKPFAVGFRVEHPQEMMNRQIYGEGYPPCLPAAAYKVTAKTDSGRGVYSFCMCPGGYVVNASSEAGYLAINGMSYSTRDGSNANSAVIVSVSEKDFGSSDPLAGIEFQRQIEKRAFAIGHGRIPVQYLKDFQGKSRYFGQIPEDFAPAMKGAYSFGKVNEILPPELNRAFLQGMEHFHRIYPGFADDHALVSGIESRTSSPVRILRGENGQSSISGLYPCGEGAGYAGGIMSAAMDGIYIAEKIVEREYIPKKGSF